jgi:hypothetical protein
MARWSACAALAALALAIGGCSDRGQDAEGERSSASTPRQKVRRQEGGLPDLRLKVDASTPVMLDGKQASVAELREGTQVRASYDEVNGERRAMRIEAHGVGAGTQR